MNVIVTVFIFVLSCNAQVANPISKNVNDTDGQSCEKFVKQSPSPTQTEHLEGLSTIRQFLWDNWTSKRACTLRFEANTKEGEKVFSVYKILISESDRPTMVVSIDRDYADRNPRSETYGKSLKASRNYTVTDIGRIKVPKDGLVKRQNINPASVLSGKDFMLQLKDSSGKVLSEI